MSVFCITSQKSIGCTFFDWSMYFLSGQENFYNVKKQQWIDIVPNPVQEINAHGHSKNHPSGSTVTNDYINQLLAKSQDCLYSVYPSMLNQYTIAAKLNIPIESVGLPENQLTINQFLVPWQKKKPPTKKPLRMLRVPRQIKKLQEQPSMNF